MTNAALHVARTGLDAQNMKKQVIANNLAIVNTTGFKKVRANFETLAYQLDRFDQMSPKLQEDLLEATLEDLDTQVSGVKDMVKAWTSGDVSTVEKLTLTAFLQSPELYQRLLLERNQNWIAHVEKPHESRCSRR